MPRRHSQHLRQHSEKFTVNPKRNLTNPTLQVAEGMLKKHSPSVEMVVPQINPPIAVCKSKPSGYGSPWSLETENVRNSKKKSDVYKEGEYYLISNVESMTKGSHNHRDLSKYCNITHDVQSTVPYGDIEKQNLILEESNVKTCLQSDIQKISTRREMESYHRSSTVLRKQFHGKDVAKLINGHAQTDNVKERFSPSLENLKKNIDSDDCVSAQLEEQKSDYGPGVSSISGKLSPAADVNTEKLRSIYGKVLVVDSIPIAEEVVKKLTTQYKHLVHACDTEVSDSY